MISDVLGETIEELNRYQRDFPEAYAEPLASEIDRVKYEMHRLMRALHTPEKKKRKRPEVNHTRDVIMDIEQIEELRKHLPRPRYLGEVREARLPELNPPAFDPRQDLAAPCARFVKLICLAVRAEGGAGLRWRIECGGVAL